MLRPTHVSAAGVPCPVVDAPTGSSLARMGRPGSKEDGRTADLVQIVDVRKLGDGQGRQRSDPQPSTASTGAATTPSSSEAPAAACAVRVAQGPATVSVSPSSPAPSSALRTAGASQRR